MKKYIITLFVFIVIIGIILIGNKKMKKIEHKEYVRIVGYEIIEKGEVSIINNFYGKIQGKNQTEIFSDVPGKFIHYTVKEGDYVKKNQTIAEIDRSIPGMNFENAKVRAPIEGIVYDLIFEKGMPVVPQRPIAMISDNKKLIAQCDVSSEDLSKIQKDNKVNVYIEDKKYSGQIIRKSQYVNNMTNLGSVDILVKTDKKNMINKACLAKIYIIDKKNTLRIPIEAYQVMDNEEFVYTYSNNKAHKVLIKSGIHGDNYIEVLSGLNIGDTLITVGSKIIRNNQKVKIK